MSKAQKDIALAPEVIENKIFLIRGKKVMLDRDLALLYKVESKQLKRQVRRNLARFPVDFMFMLSTSEDKSLRCQNGTLKRGEHTKYPPYAFTENGVAMLSSVLNSERAVQVNIQIIRIFTRIRKLLASHKEILKRLDQLEAQTAGNRREITRMFDVIREMLELPITLKRKPKPMGFIPARGM